MSLFFEISKEVWRGNIQIELIIAQSDLSTSNSPSPCYLFVPRMSYLGVVAADSIEYLKSYAIDLASDVWFESEGLPLKSNIPLGVLFDLRCVQNTIGPWRIVVRFRDFPSDAVIRCSTRDTAEKMYMHTLKQALFVLQGNTRSFNAMVLEQQQLLWEGANSGSRGIFESVADDLRGLEAVKCIPIRILYRRRRAVASHREHGLSGEGINIDRSVKINESTNQDNYQPSFICIQKPVYVYTNDGKVQESLLSDVLEQFIPGILSDGPSNLPQCISVLIQGIDVPLDAPLWQLWKLCAHADFFLYVVVSDTS